MKHTEKSWKKTDMMHGPLVGKILLFALPLAAASILQQLFNSADVAVVGHFAGSSALAAVGSSSAVINLLINLFTGLSVGTNVVIAGFIGSRDTKKIQNAVHTSIVIALASGVFLLFLGILVARPVLTVMGTPGEILDQAVLYLRLYFLGMPFFMFYNFGSAILRSKGDTSRPLYALLVSGVVNVLLNLFFVIVFHMGVAGVAVATVTANGVSAGLIFRCLVREEEDLRLHPEKLGIQKRELLRIIRIGAPAGVQGLVFSLSNVCIQSAINGFGANAVAGSAAAINFEYFAYFMVNAFAQSAVTFTSQNYGAGKYDRCKKVFQSCMGLGAGIAVMISMLFVLGREFFIRIYAVDPNVIAYASERMLHVLPLEFMPVFYEVPSGALRGMGYSTLPAILTVIGTCGFRFLWIYVVFARIGGFGMLMNVYPATWLVTDIALLVTYFIICKKEFRGRPAAEEI